MSLGHGGRGLGRWQPSLRKMKINIHMLGVLILNRVGGEVHDADVVIVDKGAPRWRGLKLVK
jgi:hypothetical protein